MPSPSLITPLRIPIEGNLILRTLEDSDSIKVFELIDSSRHFLEQTSSAAKTLDEVLLGIQTAAKRHAQQESLTLGIWDGDNYIGSMGTKPIKWKHRRAEIGYFIGEQYTGRGYATKALNAFIHFLFSNLDIHRVEAITATDNAPSIRLLERSGFTREGTLRDYFLFNGKWTDNVIYSLLRQDRT